MAGAAFTSPAARPTLSSKRTLRSSPMIHDPPLKRGDHVVVVWAAGILVHAAVKVAMTGKLQTDPEYGWCRVHFGGKTYAVHTENLRKLPDPPEE